jgi:hypothetical protein
LDNMMIIDLLGGSYEYRFKDWNSQRTINWYPKMTDQQSQEKNKTQMALIPRYGLSQFASVPGGSVRGLYTARVLNVERCFAVIDTNLYEVFQNGSMALLGALTGMSVGSRSKVYMKVNLSSQLMIQDTLAGYIFNLTTNTLSQISIAEFTDAEGNICQYPGGKTLDYADGYFIVADDNGRVSFSEIGDGTAWPAFNFFTPTTSANKTKAAVMYREEVYCFGEETISIYINDGVTPFSRQFRTTQYYGIEAPDSIAVHQSGVYFLGKSAIGSAEAFLMGADYSLTPLSFPIDYLINKQNSADAEGFIQVGKDGQILYHLHFPQLKTTFVRDMTTGMWHERRSTRPFPDEDGTNPQDMYRARNLVTFAGLTLSGDWWSGTIMYEDPTVSTDMGLIRRLERTSSILTNQLVYISVYKLEFDVNPGNGTTTGQGVNPVMMVSYSKDTGNTYEQPEMLQLGNLGQYDYRVVTGKLGTARNWVIHFAVTDPVDVIVMQAVAHGNFGSW